MDSVVHHRRLNFPRDYKMFIYLWKWKFATTNMMHLKFFKEQAKKTCYTRLYRLKKYGFITNYRTISNSYWTLTKLGFQIIKDILPPLHEYGFKSEAPRHDIVCSLVHQGTLLQEPMKEVKIITEQQLRRYKQRLFPFKVPSVEWHRPDGYWSVDEMLVALEVETSIKSNIRVKMAVDFYSSSPNVKRVLWVVPTLSYGKKIIKYEELYDSNRGRKQNIVLLKDILKKLWDSPIILGPETGSNIRQFLDRKGQESPSNAPNKGWNQLLLDCALSVRKHSKVERTLHLEFVD